VFLGCGFISTPDSAVLGAGPQVMGDAEGTSSSTYLKCTWLGYLEVPKMAGLDVPKRQPKPRQVGKGAQDGFGMCGVAH
jgi:hypothetical protein